MKKVLPMCAPFTTTYPIEANVVSIMLSRTESFPWLMNSFIQLVCVDNTFVGYYDFNYKNCPYIDYQRIKSDLVSVNNSLIPFIVDSISKGYYIDLLVNTKCIYAYKNFSRDYAHDAMLYGFDTESKCFYVTDNINGGKYSHFKCSFDEFDNATKGLVYTKYERVGQKESIELLSFYNRR